MSRPFAPRERDKVDALYHTTRWRKVRQIVLARDYEYCQECKRRGEYTKGNTVHHIVEAREDIDKFWDIDNLETVCYKCHNREHPEKNGGKKKVKPKSGVVKFYSNAER